MPSRAGVEQHRLRLHPLDRRAVAHDEALREHRYPPWVYFAPSLRDLEILKQRPARRRVEAMRRAQEFEEAVPVECHLPLGHVHHCRGVHHDRDDPLSIGRLQKSLDHGVDASLHFYLIEPSLRHLYENDARLVWRQVDGPRPVEGIRDGVCADLGAFETTLCVGARLATVRVFDSKIVILALHTARRDELERDVVDVKEARSQIRRTSLRFGRYASGLRDHRNPRRTEG
jgi:hypothetical protein